MAEKHDDALILVQLRNEFYRKKFYAVLGVYILSLIVVVILACALVYVVRHPTKPLYFVVDDVGRLVKDVPLDTANMPLPEIEKWVMEAVENTYSYDYINYRTQLQEAQKYFSERGWREYMEGLRTSNNLLALTERKLVVIAKVVGKPKLLTEGYLPGNIRVWRFEIPVLVTYLLPPNYDEKSQFQNPMLVTMTVKRQSILNSYQGLGVIQLIGNLVLTPASQNINATAQSPHAG